MEERIKLLLNHKMYEVINEEEILSIIIPLHKEKFPNEKSYPVVEYYDPEYKLEYKNITAGKYTLSYIKFFDDGDDQNNESPKVRLQQIIIEYDYHKFYLQVEPDFTLFEKSYYTKSFTIVSRNDIDEVLPFIQDSVGACLFGNPDPAKRSYLVLYFDNDSFYEAGVGYFGNSGDVTTENAYLWNKGKESPYYNKGWMIWGCIYTDDDTIYWCPTDFNKPNEDDRDWIRDEYGENVVVDLLYDYRRKFTLSFESSIKSFLKELKISYSTIMD